MNERFVITVRRIAGTRHHCAHLFDRLNNYRHTFVPAQGTPEAARAFAEEMLTPNEAGHTPWRLLLIALGIVTREDGSTGGKHSFADVDAAADAHYSAREKQSLRDIIHAACVAGKAAKK